MHRRYKYLKYATKRPGSRCLPTLIALLRSCIILTIGTIVGFNIRDFMVMTCPIERQIMPSKQTSNRMMDVRPLPVQAQNSSHVNQSKPLKKPRPIFKKLPEKFLKNYPPRRPASMFPLEPWKFIEAIKEEKYFMTFLVKSACHLVERRFYIRMTWGAVSAINGKKFGVIFLVGMTRNKKQQELLEEEHKLYGDILQSDVRDDYFNLPTKVLAGFQWVTYELGDVSDFFVTTDDDCVINLPTVFDYFYFHKNIMSDKMHCGYIYDRGAVPIRKKRFKWGVPLEVYPGDVYPAFCHGGMTVWPFQILTKIYRTSETTNCTAMHLEDVLITGILRHKTYNSSNTIAPRGYHGYRGKYRRPEPFVYHLGLSSDLRRSFAFRWHGCQAGMRMGHRDMMLTKQLSAFKLNATVSRLSLLPSKSANGTAMHFVTLWNILAPRRKANTTKLESNLITGDSNPPQGIVDETMTEKEEERPVGDIIEGNMTS